MKWVILALAGLASQAQAQPATGIAAKPDAGIAAQPDTGCAIGAATLDAALRERFMALATAVLDEREGAMQAPADMVRVITSAMRQDLVRRSVHVSCDGQVFYVQDRGGVRDEVRWYGPLAMAALPMATQVAELASAPAR